MTDSSMYDEFSRHYDQFVDWEARLSVEMPFIKTQFHKLRQNGDGKLSILDAACGTGKHAIALVKAGFNCTGADFSEEMVEAARENAQGEGLRLIFRQAGFGEFARTFGENRFDGLICLGNSLPHLLDEVSLANALADLCAVLKPGGKVVLQNRNFDLVLAERLRWMPPQTFREGDATDIFARFYDFDADGRLTFNIQILHSGGEAPFSQKVISTRLWPMKKEVLEEFLAKAGFIELQYYGNLAGDNFDPNRSGNLIVTAQT